MSLRKILGLFSLALLASPGVSFAAWTPLITATDFVGVTTDVNTVGVGIITIMVIIVGIGMIIRTLTR